MADQQDSKLADLEPKPLARKYDRRCKSPQSLAAIKGAAKSEKQLGRKPLWMKHLSRNEAYTILQELDHIATWAELYAWAKKAGKLELMVSIREYLWNRLEGKPYTAENPAKQEPKPVDPKLQEAIKTLLPQAKAKPDTKTPVM